MGYFSYLRSGEDYNWSAIEGITLTPSSEDAAYPAENASGDLNTTKLAAPWRTTGDTSESLLFDLLSARSVTLAAILNHNLSSGATITVKAGTSTAVSNYSTSMTWREFDAWVSFASQSYRYWKFEFVDTANPDGFIQIGYVMLGVLETFNERFMTDWPLSYEALTRVDESEAGVIEVEPIIKRKRLALKWRNLSDAQATTLVDNFLDQLHGPYEPVLVIPDADVYHGYLMRQTSQPSKTYPVSDKIGVAVSFVEESRGEIIAE